MKKFVGKTSIVIISLSGKTQILNEEPHTIAMNTTEHLPEGCIKRIHVNQNLLRRAIKGEDVAPYTVQFKGKSHPCKRWTAGGEFEGINAINKPLSCGARLYVQTTGPMVLYL